MTLSPLLFVVCLLPLTHIFLRDATPGYRFTNYRQKVNNLFLWMT